MKVRNHTPEQIVRKLREADRMLGEGSAMVEVCKHLEVARRPITGGAGLFGRRPGPNAADPTEKEIARLKAQITRLQEDLEESRRINDVQTKLFALLGELSKSADRQDRPSS
ncbi:MAG: hypothetical protein JW395_2960 [Nitrospira sp.]|nr:hypothetical protein [Nitrospira sp.]